MGSRGAYPDDRNLQVLHILQPRDMVRQRRHLLLTGHMISSQEPLLQSMPDVQNLLMSPRPRLLRGLLLLRRGSLFRNGLLLLLRGYRSGGRRFLLVALLGCRRGGLGFGLSCGFLLFVGFFGCLLGAPSGFCGAGGGFLCGGGGLGFACCGGLGF